MSLKQRLNDYIYFSKKNVSQLAKDINVSQSSLNKISNGDGLPSAKVLISLAKLGLNINWLLIGEGEMLVDSNLTTEPNIEYQTKRVGDSETFQDAIRRFYESSEDNKEAWKKLLYEKDIRLKEKDQHLKEKERIIETKDKMIELLEARTQS